MMQIIAQNVYKIEFLYLLENCFYIFLRNFIILYFMCMKGFHGTYKIRIKFRFGYISINKHNMITHQILFPCIFQLNIMI